MPATLPLSRLPSLPCPAAAQEAAEPSLELELELSPASPREELTALAVYLLPQSAASSNRACLMEMPLSSLEVFWFRLGCQGFAKDRNGKKGKDPLKQMSCFEPDTIL